MAVWLPRLAKWIVLWRQLRPNKGLFPRNQVNRTLKAHQVIFESDVLQFFEGSLCWCIWESSRGTQVQYVRVYVFSLNRGILVNTFLSCYIYTPYIWEYSIISILFPKFFSLLLLPFSSSTNLSLSSYIYNRIPLGIRANQNYTQSPRIFHRVVDIRGVLTLASIWLMLVGVNGIWIFLTLVVLIFRDLWRQVWGDLELFWGS